MNSIDSRIDLLERYATIAGGFALLTFCLVSFGNNAYRVLQSSDTAWLIKTGEYMLNQGKLPATDVFSWTNEGRAWVVYQWVFETIVGWLNQIGGLWLVGLVSYLAVCLICLWMMPKQMLQTGVKLPFVFGFLSLTITPAWFWARPQLISFLLIAVFVNILERARIKGISAVMWLLPPLMVLWVNSHSFWFIGLLILLAYTISLIRATESRNDKLQVAAVFALSLMAVLINPYGAQLVSYNLSFLTQPDFGNLWELQPKLVTQPIQHTALIAYFVLSWAAMIAGRKQVPLAGLVLAAFSTALALAMYRFVPVAILLSWPYLSLALAQFEFTKASLESLRARLIFSRALPLLAMTVCLVFFSMSFPKKTQTWFTHSQSNQAAIQFLKKHPELREKMFCDEAVGCSLILENMTPVFIDTRFDFYGKQFSSDFVDCLKAQGDWQGYLQKWQIENICINAKTPLHRELHGSPDWVSVYDDKLTSIWQRKETAKLSSVESTFK